MVSNITVADDDDDDDDNNDNDNDQQTPIHPPIRFCVVLFVPMGRK